MKSLALAIIIAAIWNAVGSPNCFASAKSRPTPIVSPTPWPSNLPSGNPSPSPTPTSTASDPTIGDQLTTSAEYHLSATRDDQVLAGAQTEAWAMMYRPANMGSGTHPLIVLLHGNHSTCGVAGSDGQLAFPIVEKSCAYTATGQCNAGEAVIPNHLGYGYLAARLASFGYVVVSINSNLGINCGGPAPGDSGLILARGRLVLRHLALLSQWNRVAGTTPSSLGIDLKGKLDFSHVGLLGHSRGGEGIRAAYQLYAQPGNHWRTDIGDPLTIQALFEIGPVDGQSSMVLNPTGAAWNVLLPLCDGDVRENEGMKPYDRSLAATSESPALPKSMFAVWGANHNFYNTYWQKSDSPGCSGATPLWNANDTGSESEQSTAISAVVPFFRAHVGAGADPTLANLFDPSYALPSSLTSITRVDRAHISSPNQANVTRVETFQGASGTSSLGQANDSQNIGVVYSTVPEHDPSLLAANISWNGPGSSVYFQDNWAANGSGLDLSSTGSLDFRVSRAVDTTLNPSSSTDFSIQLVRADGSLGPVANVSNYFNLVGPVGASADGSTAADLHLTMSTVRIPMADLGSMTNARGVRFTFDSTTSGNIFISDIDLSAKTSAVLAGLKSVLTPLDVFVSAFTGEKSRITDRTTDVDSLVRRPASEPSGSNRILRVQSVDARSEEVEIEVESAEGFEVRDALPVLRLNGREVAVGAFAPSGDLHSMSFKVNRRQLQSLPEQVEMEVGHREDPRGPVKSFGRVDRSIFRGR